MPESQSALTNAEWYAIIQAANARPASFAGLCMGLDEWGKTLGDLSPIRVGFGDLIARGWGKVGTDEDGDPALMLDGEAPALARMLSESTQWLRLQIIRDEQEIGRGVLIATDDNTSISWTPFTPDFGFVRVVGSTADESVEDPRVVTLSALAAQCEPGDHLRIVVSHPVWKTAKLIVLRRFEDRFLVVAANGDEEALQETTTDPRGAGVLLAEAVDFLYADIEGVTGDGEPVYNEEAQQ